MTLPNFFIVGAPKCGTTSLASWLAEHPNVFISKPKEPHYFNTDMKYRNVTSARAYERLFRKATDEHLAVGEASTWYLYSDEAVPNIEAICDEPRYIVMLRDPVEMAHSLYIHNVRHCQEDALSFEAAWQLQAERAKGGAIPRLCGDPNVLMYRQASALGTMLGRLKSLVSKSRILVVTLEKLKDDPSEEYQRVLEFLRLPDDGRREFPAQNAAAMARSWPLQRLLIRGAGLKRALGIRRRFGLLALNERKVKKESLAPETVKALRETFASEYDLLKGQGYFEEVLES